MSETDMFEGMHPDRRAHGKGMTSHRLHYPYLYPFGDDDEEDDDDDEEL